MIGQKIAAQNTVTDKPTQYPIGSNTYRLLS